MPVNYHTFLRDIIPVLGGHQEVLDCVAYFEMDLDPTLLQTFLEVSAKPFVVWDHTENVPIVVAVVLFFVGWLLWWF